MRAVEPPSFEVRLLQVLAAIAVVAILGVLAILPYRLYQRDIRHATVHAHRISSVVHTALSRALVEGGDATDLINRLQGIADLDIRLSRSEAAREDPAEAARPGASRLEGTDLTYVSPPIYDREGRTWVAHLHFDLSPMKRESVRLILDLVLAVVLGSAAFSAVVFLLVRRSILGPLRRVTESVEQLAPDAEGVGLPAFQSREMAALGDAIERACRARRPEAPGPEI